MDLFRLNIFLWSSKMDKNPEVIPGAEPFLLKRGSVGCLLLHGYTGTPNEMLPLAQSLADANYTVLAPRLFGHATHPDDMLRARWWDWVASAEDGLNLLKGCTEQQVVMGLSMGGILALILAARHPVEAVCSFSTPYDLPKDPRLKFLPWIYWMIPKQPKGKSDWHDPEISKTHIDYPYFPTRSIMELRDLLTVLRSEVPAIKAPAFFAQSHGDHTIPPESLDYLINHVSSEIKEELWVENSGHVIIKDLEKEKAFTEVKQFLKTVLGKK
jgi:carboxylesterase